ncbi:hypothetical protein SAMN02910447_03073 [Ruminococcus sp. YE71]|uniref:hypothetical protein n=1 Tax=unclassified Ruminococcus TaxID=2608920 RepID=UPI00088855B3|nr:MULTISPECIES: hypothetical protein [unclassified Ruminococcus]SDA29561.1 hypothetical protein SAMN02910446_03145 [Ruminococcus sp. YE78]SFW48495.1 hypothetical protein SAMN02910447_03073 [Ruminococcus sp. YE71]
MSLNIYTVSFFGHRELPNLFALEDKLMSILRNLINSKEYVEFLVGRDGDFDLLASAAIKRAVASYGNGNTHFTLVLPYMKAEYRNNEKEYLNYYDEVEVCAESSEAHPKSAIFERNKQMIIRSDLVICAIERKSGGAAKAVKYAEQHGKKIINLFDDEAVDKLP